MAQPDTMTSEGHVSPWRPIFEQVRREVGNERDEHGTLGSINWLRHHMEVRGANPNVVRNIIYRDKGRLPDKQVLFAILTDLWRARGQGDLHAPDLQALLYPGAGQEQEVLTLLGREKRRAFKTFVQGVRADRAPKLLVLGRPGSGKTLLTDLIEQALADSQRTVIRSDFAGQDLATGLSRLGTHVGVPAPVMESRLVKVGSASSFAVQADAQAEVARAILDAARQIVAPTFLLHVAPSIAALESIGRVVLRLNVPDVPRVTGVEWLWSTLFEPLARIPGVALLVSMSDLPVRAQARMGDFEGPIRLMPPSANEARRYVRARLPNASGARHEEIVRQAGRSFEELRTLTLLAQLREDGGGSDGERSIAELASAIELGDERMRHFLDAVAVLSHPEYPEFERAELSALQGRPDDDVAELIGAFLDGVPGRPDVLRCFSRELSATLRERLTHHDRGRYRALHLRAAEALRAAAEAEPGGQGAHRYLTLLFEARAWPLLDDWMQRHATPQALIGRLWHAAVREIATGTALEGFAQRIADHYVKLGTFEHPDVRDAFAILAASSSSRRRTWTTLRRAEGLTLRGQYDQAEALLGNLPLSDDPGLHADALLARASIERWRGRRGAAANVVFEEVPRLIGRVGSDPDGDAVRVKAALWAGLLAKDLGDLDAALTHFDEVPRTNDLDAARVAFQRGDVFMRLGHFDRALREVDIAVELARRSDALATERTRYLARRATIHRRRTDHAAARKDFAAARALLLAGDEADRVATDSAERAFWLARIDDEAGLLSLAEGRFDEAAAAFDRNLRSFERYAAGHRVDATYRRLRSTLRLALTYGCRSVGQPFMRPFAITPALDGDTPDLRQARGLIAQVLDFVDQDPGAWQGSSLARDTLLAANLFAADPRDALAMAEQSLWGAHYPYQRAQAHAHAAAGALRLGDAMTADQHVEAAVGAFGATLAGIEADERGDVELRAWLIALGTVAAVSREDLAQATARLTRGLADHTLAPHHPALLRQFGEALEAHGRAHWVQAPEVARALSIDGRLDAGALRLPDALVAHWLRRDPTSQAPVRA